MKDRRKIGRWMILVCMVCLASCISSKESMERNLGRYYIYKFGIKENRKNWKKPYFKDDIVSVEFTPNYNNVGIEIVNNSYEMITIDWNRVTFEENDIKSNVLVWGSDLAKKLEVLPVNVLKPGQGVKTGVIPTELVHYAPKDSLADKSGYVVRQMYPDYDGNNDKESAVIMGLLGVELFRLKIPIIIRNQSFDYTFTFVPVEIERVPTPPIPRKSH